MEDGSVFCRIIFPHYRHTANRCNFWDKKRAASGDWGSGIPLRGLGFIAFSIPHSAAAGALAQQQKKFKRAAKGPSCFLYTVIPYASKLASVCQCTKKALKRCLRAFFCCCAVRGGFEPPVRLPVRQFSKLVVSATHPSHLSAQWVICLHKRFGTAKIC